MTKKLLLTLALATLAGCGGSEARGPDVAACEKAMRAQYEQAVEQGTEGKRPKECAGVSDQELERIVGKILSDQTE